MNDGNILKYFRIVEQLSTKKLATNICVYVYIYIIFGLSSELRVFRGGLRKERRIGNATQPDSVFIDVQQFYLAIDISNLAFLSSTCSVYFMRPQIRRPAALEVSRKGEKYESDGVKRLPKTNFPINLERFNKLITFHHPVVSRFFSPRSIESATEQSLRRRFCNIVNFKTRMYIYTYIYIYVWFTFSSHRRLLPMYLPNRSLNTPIYLKVTLIYRANAYTWTSRSVLHTEGRGEFFIFFFLSFFQRIFFKGIEPVPFPKRKRRSDNEDGDRF